MIKNTLQIEAYFHCQKCIREAQIVRTSPRDYARLSVGYTPIGLQVWCNRHECNVLHVDFEGQKHPANTTCPKESEE